MPSISLLSWNLAGRGIHLNEQTAYVAALQPDIVAFQEVIASTREPLRFLLRSNGLRHQLDTFDVGQDLAVRTGPRRYGLLIASRWPIDADDQAGLLWPERMLSVIVAGPAGEIGVSGCHIPPGTSNGWTKIDVFEGIYHHLARPSSRARILCGDFNAPQAELPTGGLVTWGQSINAEGNIRFRRSIRGAPGGRWDAGERAVLEGLSSHGFADAFRTIHGPLADGFSWVVRRKGNVVARRRFDHVFLSSDLTPIACEYLHEPREAGLSDHAPIRSVFEHWS